MDKAWIGDAQNRIREKLHKTAERSAHKVPYTTRNGVFDDWTDNISWWTNGFWGGILWQLYHATKEKLYRELAVELEEKLDRTLMDPEGMDHDSGFRWLLTSGAHFRETGNEEAYRRTLLAACNMAGRFNPAGNFIRAWNDWGNKEARGENAGIAIIDCMMNLPLLYWASEQTKDPRFYQIDERRMKISIIGTGVYALAMAHSLSLNKNNKIKSGRRNIRICLIKRLSRRRIKWYLNRNIQILY